MATETKKKVYRGICLVDIYDLFTEPFRTVDNDE